MDSISSLCMHLAQFILKNYNNTNNANKYKFYNLYYYYVYVKNVYYVNVL